MQKNYYQILGLTPSCSKDEIKKAYRLYATKFHPDKQDSDKFFEDRFKEIKEAYDILIDDNKRSKFDSEFKFSSSTSSGTSSFYDFIKEEERKRSKVYYTSKKLLINGLYVNCNGKSYELSKYDKSTLRKDDSTNFVFIGILLIIIGVASFAYFIGILLIFYGVYLLFVREYFVVLIGKKGDVPLVKGRKAKMRKISRLINKAIVD